MDLLVTYSILSIIRDRKSNIDSLLEIYQELCESILSDDSFRESGAGLIKDIREAFEKKFELSVPYPTLQILLTNINNDNTDGFILHEDYSFQFTPNKFASLHKDIEEEENKISELREFYELFCKESGIKDLLELEMFIEINKKELLAFLNREDYEIIDHPVFNIIESLMTHPEFRKRIERMILGALISSYTDIKIEQGFQKKILVLDTNFVVSLFDLHSEVSKITCDEIVSSAKRFGFEVQVLEITVKEIENLLNRKIKSIRQVPLFSAQRPNSIEHGCYRRKMKYRDLMLYANKVVKLLKQQQITLVHKSKYSEIENKLHDNPIYQKLVGRSFNREGAKHDAIVMEYVKQLRGPDDAEFKDVKALFVTDSHGYNKNRINTSTRIPYMIRAEELINILWLLNPTAGSNITHIMISQIFSSFLEKRLPDKETLTRLDERIQSVEGLPIDKDDCRDIMLNLTLTDASQLTQLIESKDAIFREQMVETAHQLRELASAKERDEEKRIQTLINKIKERYEVQVNDLNSDKDQVIQSIKSDAHDQLDKVKAESNSARLYDKRSHLAKLRDRDQEEKEERESDSKKCEGNIDRTRRLITVVISIVVILIIMLVTFRFVLPHWNLLEPILWGLSICILLIPAFGKSIKPRNAFQRIAEKIRRQDSRRIIENKEKIELLTKRIDEANKEMENITAQLNSSNS